MIIFVFLIFNSYLCIFCNHYCNHTIKLVKYNLAIVVLCYLLEYCYFKIPIETLLDLFSWLIFTLLSPRRWIFSIFIMYGSTYPKYYLFESGEYLGWSCLFQMIHKLANDKLQHFSKRCGTMFWCIVIKFVIVQLGNGTCVNN
jgi:hypothetical protein